MKKWKRRSNTNDNNNNIDNDDALDVLVLIWFGAISIFLSSIKVIIYNDIKTAFDRNNEASYNDSVHY